MPSIPLPSTVGFNSEATSSSSSFAGVALRVAECFPSEWLAEPRECFDADVAPSNKSAAASMKLYTFFFFGSKTLSFTSYGCRG
jgi:hypothetical protein